MSFYITKREALKVPAVVGRTAHSTSVNIPKIDQPAPFYMNKEVMMGGIERDKHAQSIVDKRIAVGRIAKDNRHITHTYKDAQRIINSRNPTARKDTSENVELRAIDVNEFNFKPDNERKEMISKMILDVGNQKNRFELERWNISRQNVALRDEVKFDRSFYDEANNFLDQIEKELNTIRPQYKLGIRTRNMFSSTYKQSDLGLLAKRRHQFRIIVADSLDLIGITNLVPHINDETLEQYTSRNSAVEGQNLVKFVCKFSALLPYAMVTAPVVYNGDGTDPDTVPSVADLNSRIEGVKSQEGFNLIGYSGMGSPAHVSEMGGTKSESDSDEKDSNSDYESSTPAPPVSRKERSIERRVETEGREGQLSKFQKELNEAVKVFSISKSMFNADKKNKKKREVVIEMQTQLKDVKKRIEDAGFYISSSNIISDPHDSDDESGSGFHSRQQKKISESREDREIPLVKMNSKRGSGIVKVEPKVVKPTFTIQRGASLAGSDATVRSTSVKFNYPRKGGRLGLPDFYGENGRL